MQTSPLASKYRLLEQIAEGGMGSVWRAEHCELGSPVAIKLLNGLTQDERALERFRQEARLAAGLQHPNIVRVFDYGREKSFAYLAMELLDGEDLKQRLTTQTLTVEAVSRLVEQCCSGLGLAHRAGLVHRDLKPANLFLAREGDLELLKIIDFGIATHRDAPLHSSPGTVVGTLSYMSPEQVQGLPLDARSDLWSLAVIAYEMLAGQRPFSADNAAHAALAICHQRFPSLSSLRAGVPPSVDAFFARAFERDVKRRYPSASAFAQAFRAAWLDSSSAPAALVVPRTDDTTELCSKELCSTELAASELGLRASKEPFTPNRRGLINGLAAIGLTAVLFTLGLVKVNDGQRMDVPAPLQTAVEDGLSLRGAGQPTSSAQTDGPVVSQEVELTTAPARVEVLQAVAAIDAIERPPLADSVKDKAPGLRRAPVKRFAPMSAASSVTASVPPSTISFVAPGPSIDPFSGLPLQPR